MMEIQERTREYRRLNNRTTKVKSRGYENKNGNFMISLMVCGIILGTLIVGKVFQVKNITDASDGINKLVSSNITEENLKGNIVGRALLDFRFALGDNLEDNISVPVFQEELEDTIDEINFRVDENLLKDIEDENRDNAIEKK